ncbi:MAG: hypothetical protein M3237_19170, partial [Actinomycetota bacterium]|nr:hypothetical protein [Actinomycetota bacterium]
IAGTIGGVRSAAAATAAAPGTVADAIGVRIGRAKDFVAERSAATAVAGVAAIVMVGGGIFVVGQSTDGQLKASSEAPLGVVLDNDSSAPTEASDPDEAPLDRIGDAAAIALRGGATVSPSASDSAFDDPTDTLSETPSDPPFDVPGLPGPVRPSDDPTQGPGQEPSQQPTRPPTQQPTQPPTQQPAQPPTQQPTQPPTQAPAPPTDMSISASSNDMAGLFWSIEVRVSGLAPGRTATLVVRSSGGSSTGLTFDGRCSRVSGGGATCRVSETPSSYRFGAQALLGGPNTLTFTVYPDGDTDANPSDNSTSVTIRP